MNERIKELARQSQMVFWPTDPEVVELSKDIDIEKFAELIVRECAEIADKSNQGSKSSNEGTEFYYNADIGDKIKEHFGS